MQLDGPHPAGLPGTVIHRLCNLDTENQAWYINYQDVIAIGKLFRDGELWTKRVVTLNGVDVDQPRAVKTWLGANLGELLRDYSLEDKAVISGPLLSRTVGQERN